MATLAPRFKVGDAEAMFRATSINPSISVAALTWGSYDYLLTLQDEITYIWNKPIHKGSLLFLWVRYYGLLAMWFRFFAILAVLPHSAHIDIQQPNLNLLLLSPVSEVLAFAHMYSVQVVLQIRIHVMYQSKRLLVFNVFLFFAEIVAMLAIWSSRNPFTPCTIFGLFFPESSCTADYPTFYIPAIIFELWIGSLAFAKFIRRTQRAVKLSPTGRFDVVSRFFRDSAVHYGLTIFGLIIYNVAGFLGHVQADPGLLDASFFIAASRLTLRLRAAYYTPQIDESSNRVSVERRARTTTRLADESFWADSS